LWQGKDNFVSSPKRPDNLWGQPTGGETARPWGWQLISIHCRG